MTFIYGRSEQYEMMLAPVNRVIGTVQTACEVGNVVSTSAIHLVLNRRPDCGLRGSDAPC
eukprot:365665-Chlamydomonas_euryale.AAC.22